jgi:hypothetical protein
LIAGSTIAGSDCVKLKPERPCGLEIDLEQKPSRLLSGQVDRFLNLEHMSGVIGIVDTADAKPKVAFAR